MEIFLIPESLSEIVRGLNENWSNSGKMFFIDCKEFDTKLVTSSSDTCNNKTAISRDLKLKIFSDYIKTFEFRYL